MIQRIKGTQDFIDMTLFDFIIKQVTHHLEKNNFHHIATPLIEPLDLFQRSLGTQTDVVSKEMFVIEPRTEESERICLRPEATASTVRAFIENHIEHLPWKVFTWGPMFRYERPQKGRYRQFHQINMEIIGSASISQDAYLITLLDRLFSHVFDLDAYALLINFLGTRTDREQFKKVLLEYLEKYESSLCKTCLVRKDTNLLRVLDCKNPTCQEIFASAPLITDSLSAESRQEWETLQEQLSVLSVSYKHAPRLVRGLDYYNKTVFEFSSPALGAQNAFCGGGRYDQLVAELGGREDQPAIGAAIGIERLMLLLEQNEKAKTPSPAPLHVILPLSEAQETLGLIIADTLLASGFCTDIVLGGSSLKSMMRKVNKMGARFALIIGADEQANGTVVLKNMVNGTQETIAQQDLVRYLNV